MSFSSHGYVCSERKYLDESMLNVFLHHFKKLIFPVLNLQPVRRLGAQPTWVLSRSDAILEDKVLVSGCVWEEKVSTDLHHFSLVNA